MAPGLSSSRCSKTVKYTDVGRKEKQTGWEKSTEMNENYKLNSFQSYFWCLTMT